MDRFQSMQVFAKVVELNSFSRAADALRLPRSTVSVIVRKLEAHLRARLMQRTTRRLNLTPEGAEYYRHCIRILAEISESEEMLASAQHGPRGRLSVQMSMALGRIVVLPAIDDFHKRFPDLELMIGLDDEPVHPSHENLDCTIRMGEPEDPGVIQRRLCDLEIVTAGSPDYLLRYGEPQRMEDLQQHLAVQCLSHATGKVANFMFDINDDAVEVGVPAVLSISDAEACAICSARGMGLIQAPRFILAPYLNSGTLVEVLSQWQPRPMRVAAVFPHRRQVALKARVFVEWAAELFEKSPLFLDNPDFGDPSSSGYRVDTDAPLIN
ncbi:LysR family transcriptional regulator [Paraburkholderia caledonica]|jgi:LysR family transcriptional regulator for bpeEF and oprC|uniref:LysR family transcriptional regulator n=1 Tax=Paraburkholderia caledonica TaxID=134536 RepID=UPI0005AA1149|nr:LysR family transcriptional regulator [Paraburkholderia caledonica]